MSNITKAEVDEIVSTPIVNNYRILNHLCDLSVESYSNGKICLTSNISKELERLFGSHNRTIRNEHNIYVWTLVHNELLYNVFVAKNRGCSFEICQIDSADIRKREKEQDIIDFLSELYNLINNN